VFRERAKSVQRLDWQQPAGAAPITFGSPVKINIPNFITLGRVIAVPVIFWLLVTGKAKTAFFVFVLAGISDAVDGYLAKRFNWRTELGAFLDPLADKLLIVSIYIALGVRDELPSWLVIAVVSRDILILMAVLLSWLMGHPVRIRPLTISKLNTASQILLAAFVLAVASFDIGGGDASWLGQMVDLLRTVLVWITGVLTFWSLGTYLKAWLFHMTGYESGGANGSAA
jgi:cardiolipin synthase (CMP-forming)